MSGTVVLLGKLPVERAPLEPLAKKFGWSVQSAENLSQVESLGASNIVSILFNPQDLHRDWRHALQMVAHAVPDAFPIICCRFSEVIYLQDAAETGAFHLLHYPFALNEVRQSFGFAREAQQRRRSQPAAHKALALALEVSPDVHSGAVRATPESRDDGAYAAHRVFDSHAIPAFRMSARKSN